jgi:hypothetical protein
MTAYYYLSGKTLALISVFSINDVPVVRDPHAKGINTDELLNKWLLPGSNSIDVFLAWPTQVDYSPGKAACELSLFIADPAAEVPQPGNVLASLTWPQAGCPEVYPFVFRQAFEVTNAPATKLWNEAADIKEISDGDRLEIVRIIERFRQAVMTKDSEQAYEIMNYRYADEARAEGKEVSRVRNAILTQYRWLFGRGNLISTPVVESKLTFKIVGNSKMVWVSTGGHESALTLEESDSKRVFGFEFFFSRIGGDWTVVR